MLQSQDNYLQLKVEQDRFETCYKECARTGHETGRLDSNIESKSSNNTYLNIIEILFLI